MFEFEWTGEWPAGACGKRGVTLWGLYMGFKHFGALEMLREVRVSVDDKWVKGLWRRCGLLGGSEWSAFQREYGIENGREEGWARRMVERILPEAEVKGSGGVAILARRNSRRRGIQVPWANSGVAAKLYYDLESSTTRYEE